MTVNRQIANRRPGAIWSLREGGGYVRTAEDDRIEVVYLMECRVWDQISLSRKDARLLAKRLNQCLDATVKR